jgi:hypothetical protein
MPAGSPLNPGLARLQGSFAPQPAAAMVDDPPQVLDEHMPAVAMPHMRPMPSAPPSAGTVSRKQYRPFAKENRQNALLAIGTGLLSHPESFAAGIGAAGENIGLLRKGYQDLQRKSIAIGGPDDSFEVTTDPLTGQRTYKPITEFQDYKKAQEAAKRAPKAAALPGANDNVLMRGKTMGAIMRIPEAQRPAAYKALIADSKALGYDMGGLPDEYSPSIAQAFSDQTVSPTDRMKDDRATASRTQAAANADRNFGLAQQRQGLAERKYTSPPSTRKSSKATAFKPPAGFVLNP